MKKIICLAVCCTAMLIAAEPQPAAANKVLDSSVKGAEHDIVSLVEAMPADKFGFAPSTGAKGCGPPQVAPCGAAGCRRRSSSW